MEINIHSLNNDKTVNEYDINFILSTIKDQLTKDTIPEASQIMKRSKIKSYVSYLVGKRISGDTVTERDYQNLYLLIHILQDIYNYSGEDTGVSDYDYDRLYELLQDHGIELISTPLLTKPSSTIRKHQYPTLRGTLSKIYRLDDSDEILANKSRDSLSDWVNRCEKIISNSTGRQINLWNEEIYVFPKWDGVSVEFEFNANGEIEHALLRGNTETNEAEDVAFVFQTLVSKIKDPNIIGKPYGLKTEVMMSVDNFKMYNKRYGKTYKDTRSIVSSILNTDTLDGRENLLEIIGLRTSTLQEDGTETLQELAEDVFHRPYLRCRLQDTVAIREFAYKHRTVNGLNCDGAVIYIIDPNLRFVLGRENHKNRYEVAYKFNEEIAYTKIKDITFSTTIFGRVFPTANFEKVTLKSRKISNVSLGSMARFHELHLAKGDTVKILYEIIPYLVMDDSDPNCKRSKQLPISPPTHCPECGDLLDMNSNGTILACINPNCPCRMRGKLVNYVTKMGMKGIGEETITALFKAGLLMSIIDFYKLHDKISDMKCIDGFNTISIKNILTAIESKRQVSASVFMASIGIECIGKKTFEKIFERYTVDDLIEFAEDMDNSKLITINGINTITAIKILNGINENKKIIRKLLDNYITIQYESKATALFRVTFHKIRSQYLSELIYRHGGIVSDNLTKSVDVMIVPNGFEEETSKTRKAKEWNIPIIDLDRAEMFIRALATATEISNEILNT